MDPRATSDQGAARQVLRRLGLRRGTSTVDDPAQASLDGGATRADGPAPRAGLRRRVRREDASHCAGAAHGRQAPGAPYDAAVPLGEVGERAEVVTAGTVRATRTSAPGQPLAWRVTLADDTGTLQLVWLGRREIRGVVPGARLRVRGHTCRMGGVLGIYNPDYELLPTDPPPRETHP